MTRVLNSIGAAVLVLLAVTPRPAAAQAIPTEGPAINPTIYKVPAGAKTITVDCDDAKQSLTAALADKSTGDLNIVFSGTCKEYVTFARDGVSIRGKDANATLAGGIEITASKRVLLENFTCRDNTASEYCIGVQHGSNVNLHNIKVFNSSVRGVSIQGSAGIIDGLTIDKTNSTSMLIRGSTIRMEGDLTFSNSLEGCLVLDSVTSVFSKIGNFVARDCVMGVLIQNNSTVEAPFATWTLNHNSFAGMLLYTHGTLTYGGSIVAKNNAKYGIWADDASSISPLANIVSGSSMTFENNGEAGVQATQGSYAELANVTANTGSKYGVLVDDARLRVRHAKMSGNTAGDIRLQFGGRVTFGPGAEVATMTCDGTEMVRGAKALQCTKDEPKPKATTDKSGQQK
jgi:hypothetical protein